MNLKLDYKQPAESKTSEIELTADYINFAINNKYKDGIEGQLKRVVGRIQRKLEAAVEGKKAKVEFEEAEIDLLKKCFETAKVPPQLVKFWTILEDEIEKLGKESK